MSYEEKRFCVYLHKRKDNGEVFYVGQGSFVRPTSKSQRSLKWCSTVEEAGGFTVDIIKSELDKIQAITLEKELIEFYHKTCVNCKSASSIIKNMSFDMFDDLFYIDETSPTGLRHKKNLYAGTDLRSLMKRSGDIAGNVGGAAKYSIISVNRKNYMVHRIVYLLEHGSIDSLSVIDHVNGNSRDNCVVNLRAVTQLENICNRKMLKNNTTGKSGVTYRTRSNSFEATLKIKTHRITKNFSCNKYGTEKALSLAINWREEQEKVHSFGLSSIKE